MVSLPPTFEGVVLLYVLRGSIFGRRQGFKTPPPFPRLARFNAWGRSRIERWRRVDLLYEIFARMALVDPIADVLAVLPIRCQVDDPNIIAYRREQ